MLHIIPDIHGQAEKLDDLLAKLGWSKTAAGWRGPDPKREIVFLGDFIDRGPENERVIRTVRSLTDSGKAKAIMGNHEFNAIHFHTEINGKPLRERSEKNTHQHESFLNEFPLGSAKTREVIDWMKTLPLFIENKQFRAIHACWYTPATELLGSNLVNLRLSDEVLHQPHWTQGDTWDALQCITSGVEIRLPDNYSFLDKSDHERHHIRMAWWLNGAKTWKEVARSVPETSSLPEGEIPEDVAKYVYKDHKPVFFGHYWLTGPAIVEAPFALCLDYSAGKAGPLVAYDFDPAQKCMDASRILNHR
ncbi:metallophosphoesterase [Ruegeria arenilitoris]|uniref:metallophosphoesterase n=1 Tax=Ruegeria arenilitoris TaxID=1173585 RepID=UPI003463A6FF